MDHSSHNRIVSFIWSIADDCLRDVFVRGKYRDVILPMFVLRRIDCLLEDTKEAVLAEVKFQKEEAGMAVLDPDGLREASGQVFYNTSRFTLKSLLGNPSQLEANFNHYLDGFSDNVAEIIAKFDLRNQIRKMAEADALHGVIEKFVDPKINLSHHDAVAPDGRKLPGLSNLGMGYVFEELIRKFNEDNNEEAGEHFTPREVIQLMVHLLFEPVKKKLPPFITIYDPACGSGGMLTEAQDFIIHPDGPVRFDAAIYLYGKEVNPETYAICKSDMMIKGNNPANIKYGSTLATDEFSSLRFDFMLSNPPYGKSWKTDQGQILEKNGSKIEIIDPRFEVELPDSSGDMKTVSAAPAVDDGQLLFLMEMVNKMKRIQDSPAGSRIATVHNGSALFTGNAGGGSSNIRQYLIENDFLEAIIQLPNNIFYNTGITTYVWILTNRKPKKRRGKVQLIDASQLYEKLRKNLGAKNCAFTSAHIAQITRAYLKLLDTGKESVDGLKSQVFDNREFGYWKVTVERPLRKSAQFSADRIAPLRFDNRLATEMEWIYSEWGDAVYEKNFLARKKNDIQRWLDREQIELKSANLKKLLDPKIWLARRELLEIAKKLLHHFGDRQWDDFALCTAEVKTTLKESGVKTSPAQLKAILDAVSWRNPDANPILKGMSVFTYNEFGGKGYEIDPDQAAIYGHYPLKGGYWHYESDSELRDTENVPLNYPGGIDAYFRKEVLPHVSEPPAPRPSPGQFCIYVLKCSDDSFYIGQTEDFPRRLAQHESKDVSWTAPRLPVTPIHWETFGTREEAVKREQDLKTGFGRKWLKREYAADRLMAASRQAGAWIDKDKTVIGYEISFNKYFYVHQPLRDLAEVVKEIRDLEAETEGLLEKILDFGTTKS